MHNLTAQEAETIARLATKARNEGIKLYRDQRDGRHYASSSSQPGQLYFVTLASCTCPGFLTHGHCKHWAALTIAMLGFEIQPDPETHRPVLVSITTAECLTCHGDGEIHYERQVAARQWIGDWMTCPTCHGSRTREVFAPVAA